MSVIAAVAPVLPPRSYPQESITAALADLVTPRGSLGAAEGGSRRALLERLHAHCGVRQRHLVLPLEGYASLGGFGDANETYLRHGVDLGATAIAKALADAGLAPSDVDVVLSTTITGVAAPSLDARLVEPLGLRPDVKRLPIFGLGCVAGAAGLARLEDYLAGHPDEVAVLLSVELCSLTIQRGDDSTANLVASGLFGDAAAAVVLVGDRRAAAMGLVTSPHVVGSRSSFYPDTAGVMGWDVGGSGFRIVLTTAVSDVVDAHLADDVETFLQAQGRHRDDVSHWIVHPGGPRVLEAAQRALDLRQGALGRSWDTLATIGNVSSASVLHILAGTLDDAPPPGSLALMVAFGPGFCAELVLIEWPAVSR